MFMTCNLKTVDKIIRIVDFNDKDLFSKKFLEPSCGNGILIVRLLEKVFESNITIEKAKGFIESSLFFVDIEENMIETTKHNIAKLFRQRFKIEYTGRFNSYVFDYTQRLLPKHNTLFDSVLDVPLTKLISKVDYIIGNPPYVSLYGRRDRKKDEAQRIYYLSRFSQFPDSLKNGKINFVMLFIEQSVDLLREGGKLSFIIDLAFFETAYQHTRKYLLKHTRILSIEYNIRDFEVASGQVIIQIQKEKVNTNFVSIINAGNNARIKVNQSMWANPDDQYKFRFNLCSTNSKIIDKIKQNEFPSLKELYPHKNLRTCAMLLNMEDQFVSERDGDISVGFYPYYEGSKSLSEKYCNLHFKKYFHYNKVLQDRINDKLKKELATRGVKNKKRIGLGESIVYENPKIFIRQSAKQIISTYDQTISSANNSLYVFTLRDSSETSIRFLKFLCGLLNSELITFFAQQMNIIRYSKGKQPQIKISDLYSIPVPTDKVFQDKIAQLVERVYANKQNDQYINEIDKQTYKMFGVSSSEIITIKKSIVSF